MLPRPKRSMLNANMLLTHAAAALAGHTGPARRDDRARALVDALCNGPAWVDSARRPARRAHVPGWRDGLSGGGIQHLVVDTEIAWALLFAWRAREALGARPGRRDLIADRIIATTAGEFWRWPTLRLNQINWYALMYAAAATVGGRQGAAARRELLAAAAPLRRRRAQPMARRRRSPTSAPAYASTTCRRRSRATTSTTSTAPSTRTSSAFLRRLRPGAARRHAARWTRAARSVVRSVDRARAVRLLDPRRLPELGHRPRLRALAPGQEARAHAGGAARHRAAPDALRPPQRRRGPSTMLDRAFELFDRWTERARGLPAGDCLRRAVDRRQRVLAPCSPPRACRPTPPRPRSLGLGADARRASRRRCTPTTPTSAGSPSPRPPTTRRSSPSTAARSRTAGSSSRACSTASRTSRRHRRAPAGVLRRGRPRRRREDRRRLPARGRRTTTRRCELLDAEPRPATALRGRVLDPAGARDDVAQRDLDQDHPPLRATFIETAVARRAARRRSRSRCSSRAGARAPA